MGFYGRLKKNNMDDEYIFCFFNFGGYIIENDLFCIILAYGIDYIGISKNRN